MEGNTCEIPTTAMTGFFFNYKIGFGYKPRSLRLTVCFSHISSKKVPCMHQPGLVNIVLFPTFHQTDCSRRLFQTALWLRGNKLLICAFISQPAHRFSCVSFSAFLHVCWALLLCVFCAGTARLMGLCASVFFLFCFFSNDSPASCSTIHYWPNSSLFWPSVLNWLQKKTHLVSFCSLPVETLLGFTAGLLPALPVQMVRFYARCLVIFQVRFLQETVRRECEEREELTAALCQAQQELFGQRSVASHPGSPKHVPDGVDRQPPSGHKRFDLQPQVRVPVPLTHSPTNPNTFRPSSADPEKDRGLGPDKERATRRVEARGRWVVLGGDERLEPVLPHVKVRTSMGEVKDKSNLRGRRK